MSLTIRTYIPRKICLSKLSFHLHFRILTATYQWVIRITSTKLTRLICTVFIVQRVLPWSCPLNAKVNFLIHLRNATAFDTMFILQRFILFRKKCMMLSFYLLFGMGLKCGLSDWEMIRDCECLRTGFWGEKERRERKWKQDGKSYIMRILICTFQ
jgi:hypothetical protein